MENIETGKYSGFGVSEGGKPPVRQVEEEKNEECVSTHVSQPDSESQETNGRATNNNSNAFIRQKSVRWEAEAQGPASTTNEDDLEAPRKTGLKAATTTSSTSSNTRPPLESSTKLTREPSTRSVSSNRRASHVYTMLFGDKSSNRECTYVVIAGALIAFNSGFVNGSCVSGLLTNGTKQSVAGFTSSYSKAALALADGDWDTLGFQASLILSYMTGAFISGLITPNATPYQLEPTYGPTFLIGAVFLLTASVFAALEFEARYIFFFVAAANGIQNGIASIYSANLIRCSLTGSTTDIALVLAQVLRGNRDKLHKGLVLLMIVVCFCIGGFISFYATSQFLGYTLFFNAALFWLIGASLVTFLVREHDVSVEAAILGTWKKWKGAMKKLHGSILDNVSSHGIIHTNLLLQMFDDIDDEGNGEIDVDELLNELLKAGVKIDAKGVKVLIKTAYANGNGLIDRQEWETIVKELWS